MQEGLNRSQATNTVPESGAVTEEVIVKTRAPRTCSMCKSHHILHVRGQQSRFLIRVVY
jgi:hypothetical protein